MEFFFGILKCEKYYLNKYEIFDEFLFVIDEYIYFYNYERY
ncbi:IS3 family transposase [Alkalihalophilus marmarensis]